MVITSVKFLIFTAVLLLIYWNLPQKFQWMLLLAGSLVFFFINSRPYTFIYMILAVLLVYAAALVFEKNPDNKRLKKCTFLTALLTNVFFLIVLKYLNLGIHTYNTFSTLFGRGGIFPDIHIAAPLAISFYTMSLLSYLIDCYQGYKEVEHNPLKLLLFTCYFPLMVSGPMSRHRDLGKKLFEEHRFDYDRVTAGLRRVGWGFAKKMVVADRMSYPVDSMFANPDIFTGIWVLLMPMIYSVQLYFDFSGCMDIVLGISECFGITLTENFKAPFFSRTLQEFWQRWHITLGAWLNDYILYPLLKTAPFKKLKESCKKKFGKDGARISTFPALFILWSVMGLWHGDSWKYILGEGWWYWIVIVIGQAFAGTFKKQKTALHIKDDNPVWICFQTVRTYIFFSIGMLFFRAADYPQGLKILSNIVKLGNPIEPAKRLKDLAWNNFGGVPVFIVVAAIILIQLFLDRRLILKKSNAELIKGRPFLVRWSLYFLLVYVIIRFGAFGVSSFIYFGF